MPKDVAIGGRVLDVEFGYLDKGRIRSIPAMKVLECHRVIILGVTNQNQPPFLAGAADAI